MTRSRLNIAGSLRFLAAALLCVTATGVARGEIEFEATWQPAGYAGVRDAVLTWAGETDFNGTAIADLRRLWPQAAPAEATGAALLDRLAETFALVSPDATMLVKLCSGPYEGPATADPEWLADAKISPFMRHNLRLYYARWLAQYGLYDEVLYQVADLRPVDVVDPASLLFYQMAAYHQLVQPEEARAALAQLLEHEDALPRRYQQVAQLVQRDLSALEDESLDHIARRMRDIHRRLDYGRAGAKVQEIEQGVLDSLDKKIDDLEKKQQQQQQQQQAGASGGSQQSSKPMDDSKIAELKAPMQVDRRDIGSKSGWGELPPKDREQALQQIGREFPAHYRELIEQYFRELANESTPPPE